MVIGLSDQLAYFYRGEALIAVASISTGEPGRDTPTGIFNILAQEENAPLDQI